MHSQSHKSNTRDVDLTAFMCLMVVLIPILLVSAEFARISIIEVDAGLHKGSNPDSTDNVRPRDNTQRLKLTAVLTDSVITLATNAAIVTSIPYREYHKYVARDDQKELTCPYIPGDTTTPKHPLSGRPYSIHEREEILLYACSPDDGKIIKVNRKPVSVYKKLKTMLSDVKRSSMHAPDNDAIIIASEGKIKYDKIVQVMDIAKAAGFPNVSLARLRG